ncbi:MAG: insulinase family protein, partial [Ardenticatenaceae bacterium]
QDFYNLVDVYVDAVLHPRLTPQLLQQEGWHYELEETEAPLIYKGVVFNEMKGNYSSPDGVLAEYAQHSIFPDTVYGFDAGGDPEQIPKLTWEQFKSFHESYYHPSNARIFFYGNDPADERLRLMDEYLRDFERLDVNSTIPLQVSFEKPKRLTRQYPVNADEPYEKKAMVAVNWLLPEIADFQSQLAFLILDYILIETPASPLRKALIESGLGEDLSTHGLSTQFRQMFFSTGLKGIRSEDAEQVETLILETLETLAREGIDPAMIEAALNSIEFNLRENNTGAYPRGLSLMIRSLGAWLYDADPLAPLAFEQPLEAIKQQVASGERLFESLIEEHFLDNPHRTTLVLEPDPKLAGRREAEERARLDAARAEMTREDIQRVIDETRALKHAQETPDVPELLALIPRLTLDDLEREHKPIPLEVEQHGGAQLLYHDLWTSGIAYLDLGLNLHALPAELLPYVPLFGRALLEMGTETEDFVRLSQRIDRESGGIRTDTLATVVRGSERGAAWLFLRGKAMAPQVGQLLDILHDVLTTVRLDNQERFRQMLLEEKASHEASLIPMGHQVVNRRLRAHFNEADWAAERMSGVSQLLFLRQLIKEVESDWPKVLAALERVRASLVNRGLMLANVTVDAESWQEIAPRLRSFLDALPAGPVELAPWQPAPAAAHEGLAIPAPVNYVGKAANLYDLGYELDGSA